MFFCSSNWFFCDVNEPNTCCRRVICFTSRYQCDLLTKVVKENSVKNHSKLVVQDKSLFTNVKLPRSKQQTILGNPSTDRPFDETIRPLPPIRLGKLEHQRGSNPHKSDRISFRVPPLRQPRLSSSPKLSREYQKRLQLIAIQQTQRSLSHPSPSDLAIIHTWYLLI